MAVSALPLRAVDDAPEDPAHPAGRESRESRSAYDRADAILGAFDLEHPSLSLLGLVARTGLPKTTVHRSVEKMIQLGWLTRQDGRYAPGNRLFEFAGLTRLQAELRAAALPHMARLLEATQETVHLAVLDGDQVLYVEKLTSRRMAPPIPLSRVGGHMPAYCTALGKVLVANSGTTARTRLLTGTLAARTGSTISSPMLMERELARILDDGVGFDREEAAVGLTCVAAAVTGPDGRCVAAVSVSGPSTRMRCGRIAGPVHLAAAGIRQALAS